MQGIRIKPEQSLNPAYKPEEYVAATRRGEPYDVPVYIDYPVGSIVDGPQAIYGCMIPDGAVVPYDDECHEEFCKRIGSPKLKAQLEALQRMSAPEVFAKLPVAEQARIRSFIDRWEGTKLQALILGMEQTDEDETGETDEPIED